MILILIGPPGSGKGTQGSLLAEKLRVPYIVAGEIMRNKSKSDPEIKAILDQGKLLPSDYVNKTVGESIDSAIASCNENKKFCIIDGYPRTINQANYLEKHYISNGIWVLYLTASDKTLVNRLSNRVVCDTCGHSQSLSDQEFSCSKCSSSVFSRRNDDRADIILERIEEYKKNTEPLIDFYTKNNIISIIDTEKNVNDIQEDIFRVLSENVLGFSNFVMNK